MFDFVIKGGPVMIPILLGSVIGLAIVLERGWLFWKLRVQGARLTEDILALIQAGQATEALARCRASSSPVAHVLATGVEHAELGTVELEGVMQHEGERVVQQLERHLGALTAIISIEPLLGFLGTITGLIRSFRAWERAGADVTVSNLAAGIYEAMITTAAGLIIAIPLYLAYNYFVQRIKGIAFDMSDAGNALLRALGQRRSTEEGTRAPATYA